MGTYYELKARRSEWRIKRNFRMQLIFVQLVFFGISLLFSCSAVAKARAIQIVTEEYPPYNYLAGEHLTGVGTEVVEATLNELGVTATTTLYPWARAYKIALSEENVLIYTISRTPERENLFKWVGVIAPVDQCVFSLKSRKDIKVNTFGDLKKYDLGTVIDDVQEQYLINKGIPRSRIQSNVSYEANFKKLLKGRIDLWTVLDLAAYHIVLKNHYIPKDTIQKVYCMKDLSVGGDYMAFSKKTSDVIVRQFQQALERIKEKGIYDTIVKKYRVMGNDS